MHIRLRFHFDVRSLISIFSLAVGLIIGGLPAARAQPFADPIQVNETDDGGTDAPESLRTADLDGDGDPDVISAWVGWYENQVGESEADDDGFGDRQQISESQSGWAVYAADLDGGGDPDVIATLDDGDTFDEDGKIVWYKNQIGTSQADDDGFGDANVIDSGVRRPQSVYAAKLDEDEDKDVLAVLGRTQITVETSRIVWYENLHDEPGGGPDNFSDAKEIVAKDREQYVSVHAADLNGDGKKRRSLRCDERGP